MVKTLKLLFGLIIFLFFIFPGYSYTNVSSCQTIGSSGEWRLNQSITASLDASCISIQNNDIIFDCQGFNINGNHSSGTSKGIDLNGVYDNVTIKNCNVNNFETGLRFRTQVTNSNVLNVNLTYNSYTGLQLYSTNYSTFSNVFIDNTSYGLTIQQCHYNNFSNIYISNTSLDSIDFVSVEDNSNNVLDGGIIQDNVNGIGLSEGLTGGSVNNVVKNILLKNIEAQAIRVFSNYTILSNITLINSGSLVESVRVLGSHNNISEIYMYNSSAGYLKVEGNYNTISGIHTHNLSESLRLEGNYNTFFDNNFIILGNSTLNFKGGVNNTFFRNYLGNASNFTGTTISQNFFNNSFWGNYWDDFGTCNLVSNVQGYHVCTNPANYTVNGSTYDYKPLVNINYSTNLTTSSTGSPTENIPFRITANYTSIDFSVSGVGLNRYEIGQVIWNTSDLGTIANDIYGFDCNQDGSHDCIAVAETGDLRSYYKNGTIYKTNPQPYNTGFIIAGDIDGDGFNDRIVWGEYLNGAKYIYIFNETLDQIWNNSADTESNRIYEISEFVDLDGDGVKNDFFVQIGNTTGGYKIKAYNSSDGLTWNLLWSVDSYIDTYVDEFDIGDFDRDGEEDDLAIGYGGGGNVIIVYRGEDGQILFKTISISNIHSIGAVDLDHDNYKDELLVSRYYDIYSYTWNNTLDTLYSASDVIWSLSDTYMGGEAEVMTILDLDNDGYQDDFITAADGESSGNAMLFAFDNNSNELWNYTITSIGLNEFSFIANEDINFDGKNEVIVSDEFYDTIYIFNLSGSLLWDYTIGLGDIGEKDGDGDIMFEDFNGDGLTDFAVTSSDGYIHVLQDVSCSLILDTGSSYNMTWNISTWQWEADVLVSTGGTHSYNVTCQKNGYQSQTVSNNVWVDYATNISTGGNYSNLKAYVSTGLFTANYSALYRNVTGMGLTRPEIGQYIWYIIDDTGSEAYVIDFYDCEMIGERNCMIKNHRNYYGLYYSNGSNFNNPTSGGGFSTDIMVGDLDNDNYYDEFIIVNNEAYISVFNSSGNEVWNDSLSIGGDGSISAITLADIDGQGFNNDFIVASWLNISGGIYKLFAFNSSDGQVWTRLWNTSQNLNYIVNEIEVGDLNRDGVKDEIIVADRNNYFYGFSIYDGSLLFNSSAIDPFYALTLYDIDGDGFEDEFALNGNGDVYVYDWNGTIGVTYSTSDNLWRSSIPIWGGGEIVSGDFDGGGNLNDIIASDEGSWSNDGPGIIRAYNESGDVIWSYTLATYDGGNRNALENVYLLDINKDNKEEIIFLDTDWGGIYVLNKSGSLLWSDILENTAGFGRWEGKHPGLSGYTDMNNDGIKDFGVLTKNREAYIVQDVSCYVSFNFTSTTYPLLWNLTSYQWELRHQFMQYGNFSYNVTCQKNGYQPQISANIPFEVAKAPFDYIYPTPLDGSNWNGDNLTIKVNISEGTIYNVTVDIEGTNYSLTNITSSVWEYVYTSLPTTSQPITFKAYIDNVYPLEERTITFYPDTSENPFPFYSIYAGFISVLLIVFSFLPKRDFRAKNKKGMGVIVAIILLLLLVVTTGVGIYNWYLNFTDNYNSKQMLEYTTDLNEHMEVLGFKYESNNYNIYIRNPFPSYLIVDELKVNDNNCLILSSNVLVQKDITSISVDCPTINSVNKISIITKSGIIDSKSKLE